MKSKDLVMEMIALKALNQNPNLITVDFSLPDITGDKLLKEIKTRNPNIPVIIISGQEDIQVAVSLLKQGATDYIIKDDNTKDLLWNSVIKVRENFNLKEEVETLKEELGVKYDF
jgi:two-component system response regulator AtoC